MRSFECKVPLSGRLHVSISHMAVKGGWGTSSGRKILRYLMHPEIPGRFSGLWEIPSAWCFCESVLLKSGWSCVICTWNHDGASRRDLSELGVNLSPSSYPHSCIGWYFLEIRSYTRGARAVEIQYALSPCCNNMVLLSPFSFRHSLKNYCTRNQIQRRINLSPARYPRVSF